MVRTWNLSVKTSRELPDGFVCRHRWLSLTKGERAPVWERVFFPTQKTSYQTVWASFMEVAVNPARLGLLSDRLTDNLSCSQLLWRGEVSVNTSLRVGAARHGEGQSLSSSPSAGTTQVRSSLIREQKVFDSASWRTSAFQPDDEKWGNVCSRAARSRAATQLDR